MYSFFVGKMNQNELNEPEGQCWNNVAPFDLICISFVGQQTPPKLKNITFL